jgi:hypothetical protein
VAVQVLGEPVRNTCGGYSEGTPDPDSGRARPCVPNAMSRGQSVPRPAGTGTLDRGDARYAGERAVGSGTCIVVARIRLQLFARPRERA